MEFLCEDLLVEIFAKCRLADLVSLNQINKRFSKIILKNYQSNKLEIILKGKIIVRNNSLTSHIRVDHYAFEKSDFESFLKSVNRRKSREIYLSTEDDGGLFNLYYDLVIESTKDRLRIWYIINDTRIHIFDMNTIKNQLEAFRLLVLIYKNTGWINIRNKNER